MMIFLSLLSSFLFSILYVLDSHFVGRVFDRPWVGTILSSILTGLVLPVFLGYSLFSGWQPMSYGLMGAAIGTGFLFLGCQVAHFQAYQFTESGIVAAYWSLTPLVAAFGAYWFLDECLSPNQYLGMALLIGSSFGFGLINANGKGRWNALGIMVLGCLFNAAYFLIQKWIFDQCPVGQGILFILLGVFLGGLAPMFARSVRKVFLGNLPKLGKSVKLLVLAEGLNLGAIVTAQWAVTLGSPSLVCAMEGVSPIFTFLVSAGLFLFGWRFSEKQIMSYLPIKIGLAALVAVGVWLLQGGGQS